MRKPIPPLLLPYKKSNGCCPCGAWGSAERIHKPTGSHIGSSIYQELVYRGRRNQLFLLSKWSIVLPK